MSVDMVKFTCSCRGLSSRINYFLGFDRSLACKSNPKEASSTIGSHLYDNIKNLLAGSHIEKINADRN